MKIDNNGKSMPRLIDFILFLFLIPRTVAQIWCLEDKSQVKLSGVNA
jgi:hypothetical protein